MTQFEIRSVLTGMISDALKEGWTIEPKMPTAGSPSHFRIDLSKANKEEIIRIELEEKSTIRWDTPMPEECTTVIITKASFSPVVYDTPPVPFKKWFSCSSVFIKDEPKVIEKRVFYQENYDLFTEAKGK